MQTGPRMGQAWPHNSLLSSTSRTVDGLPAPATTDHKGDMSHKQPAAPFKKPAKPSLQSRRSSFRNQHSLSEKARSSADSSVTTESSGMSQSTSETSLAADPKLQRGDPGAEDCSRRASSDGVFPADDKKLRKRNIKDVRRAEIVAAVTQRLYSTSRKPEAKPEPAAASSAAPAPQEAVKEPPGELQLCANARAKLQELSKRAVFASRKYRLRVDENVQTDLDSRTQRVKERSVGPDVPMETAPEDKHGDPEVASRATNTPDTRGPQIPMCIIQNSHSNSNQVIITGLYSPEDLTRGLLADLFNNCQHKTSQQRSIWKQFTAPPKYTPILLRSSTEECFSDDSLETNQEPGKTATEIAKPRITKIVKFSCGKHFNPPSGITSKRRNITQLDTSSQTGNLLLNSNTNPTNSQVIGIHNNLDNLTARSNFQDYLNNFIKNSPTEQQLQNISSPCGVGAEDDENKNDEMDPRSQQNKTRLIKSCDRKQNPGNIEYQPSHTDTQVKSQGKPLKTSNVNKTYTRSSSDAEPSLCASSINTPITVLNNRMTEICVTRNKALQHDGRHQSFHLISSNTPEHTSRDTNQCEVCAHECHKCTGQATGSSQEKSEKSAELHPRKFTDLANSHETDTSLNGQKCTSSNQICTSEFFFMPETNKMFLLADCDSLAPLYTVSKKILFCLGTSHEDMDTRMTLSVSQNLLNKQIITKENLKPLISSTDFYKEGLNYRAAQKIQVQSKIEFHMKTNFQSHLTKPNADKLLDRTCNFCNASLTEVAWEDFDKESTLPHACKTNETMFSCPQNINDGCTIHHASRAQYSAAVVEKYPVCAQLCSNCSFSCPNMNGSCTLKNRCFNNNCRTQGHEAECKVHYNECLTHQMNAQLGDKPQEQGFTASLDPEDTDTTLKLQSNQQKINTNDSDNKCTDIKLTGQGYTDKQICKEARLSDSCREKYFHINRNNSNAISVPKKASADSFKNFVHKFLPAIKKSQNSNSELDRTASTTETSPKPLTENSPVKPPQSCSNVICMKDKSTSTGILTRGLEIRESNKVTKMSKADASIQTQSEDKCGFIANLNEIRGLQENVSPNPKSKKFEIDLSQVKEKTINGHVYDNNITDKTAREKESNNSITKYSFNPLFTAHEQANQTESEDSDDFPDEVLALPRVSIGMENYCNISSKFPLKNKHPHMQDMNDLILGTNALQAALRNADMEEPFSASMRRDTHQPKKTMKKSVSWTDLRGCGKLHTEIILNDTEETFYQTPHEYSGHTYEVRNDSSNRIKPSSKDLSQPDNNALSVLSSNGIPKSLSLSDCSVPHNSERSYFKIPSCKKGNATHYYNQNFIELNKLVAQNDHEKNQSPAQLFQLSALLSEATCLLQVLNKGPGHIYTEHANKSMPKTNTSDDDYDRLNEKSDNTYIPIPFKTCDAYSQCSNNSQKRTNNKMQKHNKNQSKYKKTYKISSRNSQICRSTSHAKKLNLRLKSKPIKNISLSKLKHALKFEEWSENDADILPNSSKSEHSDNHDKQKQKENSKKYNRSIQKTKNRNQLCGDEFTPKNTIQGKESTNQLCDKEDGNKTYNMDLTNNTTHECFKNKDGCSTANKIVLELKKEKDIMSENNITSVGYLQTEKHNTSSQTKTPMYSDKNINTSDDFEHTEPPVITELKASSSTTKHDASTQYLNILGPSCKQTFRPRTVTKPHIPSIRDKDNLTELSQNFHSLDEYEPVICKTRKHQSYEFLDTASLPSFTRCPCNGAKQNFTDVEHCRITHYDSDTQINYALTNRTLHLDCIYGKCFYASCSASCPASSPAWWPRRHGPTDYMKRLVQVRRKVIHETRSQFTVVQDTNPS